MVSFDRFHFGMTSKAKSQKWARLIHAARVDKQMKLIWIGEKEIET